MRIVPEVAASSPAIRRSTVLFPLPDGPTRATSSPSAISSVTSRTAARPPGNTLLTFLKMIDATSTLDCSAGESRNNPALCDQHETRYRRGRDHRSGQNLSPRHLVLSAEERDGDGHCVPLGPQRERERKQKLVPAVKKSQDGSRREGWCGKRQHDLSHGAKPACTVDERSLFKVRRQLPEESCQQP